MIFHPIKKLVEAGVDEILVVTGTEHAGAVIGLLGSGRDFGCKFTYRVQDEAGGIAQALGLAEAFGRGGRLMVLLGDNIFEQSLRPFAKAFMEQERGAKILLKVVERAERFGVAVIDMWKVHCLVEKPSNPVSQHAVTGCYFYDASVFDVIRMLEPSLRGELEITDVNNAYVRSGTLTYDILDGAWTDAGTFESLRYACDLVDNLRR